MVGITGDLQKLFDKFPTPEDNFMLQFPYYPLGMRWGEHVEEERVHAKRGVNRTEDCHDINSQKFLF